MKRIGSEKQISDKYYSLSVLGALALSSLWAMAGEGVPAPSAGGAAGSPAPGSEQASKPSAMIVSLEKFREQCQDPSKSEVQRAPREIRLVCRNREVTWHAAVPGEVPLKSQRTVSTAIVSDKFRVAEVTKNLEVAPTPGTCQRYQEVIEDYAMEIPVSCEEVLHEKVGVEDLCASRLDESKDKNESAIQVQSTGRYIDTCSNLAIQQKSAQP
ncbi:MAG: hypothetical protein RJB38_800 [Pseudomonadota bacterium]|jgi:hypothetical protein